SVSDNVTHWLYWPTIGKGGSSRWTVLAISRTAVRSALTSDSACTWWVMDHTATERREQELLPWIFDVGVGERLVAQEAGTHGGRARVSKSYSVERRVRSREQPSRDRGVRQRRQVAGRECSVVRVSRGPVPVGLVDHRKESVDQFVGFQEFLPPDAAQD